jgi:hypothetical protein
MALSIQLSERMKLFCYMTHERALVQFPTSSLTITRQGSIFHLELRILVWTPNMMFLNSISILGMANPIYITIGSTNDTPKSIIVKLLSWALNQKT